MGLSIASKRILKNQPTQSVNIADRYSNIPIYALVAYYPAGFRVLDNASIQ